MRTAILIGTLVALGVSLNAQDSLPAEEGIRVLIWTSGRSVIELRQRHSVELRDARFFEAIPLISVRLSRAGRRMLEADLGARNIVEDREYRTSLVPSIPISGAPYVWDSGYTGKGESAAVIDTGINPMHPTFLGVNIVSKVFLNSGREHQCFGDDASTANDLQGHGTRTASILASQAIPQFPNFYGAARGLGTLYALKAGFRAKAGSSCPAADGVLLASDIVAAMEYVVRETPAKVVNLSVGVPGEAEDDVLSRVFDYFAEQYGLTLVYAAGNQGTEARINTPGISYNGLTVANVDDKGTEDKRDDSIHPSSTRGPTIGFRSKPDIAASGTRILAAEFNTTGFNMATGTSAAAPIVAGAAVLLRDAGVVDALAVKALLLNSTDGDGVWQRDWGWGNLNVAAAFDQRRNVLSGSVPPKSSRFFRGSVSGAFRTTLVWNRHVDASSPGAQSPLYELSLAVYRRDGSLVARSDSPRDNVEVLRVDASSGGDYVVRVEATGAAFSLGVVEEDFGLAVSRAGLAAATGPKWNMRCAMPSHVGVRASFTVTCTAENTGDIDLFQVAGSLLVAQGFAGGGPQSFGNLAVGQTRTNRWTITASGAPGVFSHATTGTADAYGVNVEQNSTLAAVEVVGGAGPGMALEPSVAVLGPASTSVQVAVTVVGALRLSAAGAPWFQVALTASGRGVAVTLADSWRALAPGTYQGEYLVSAGALSTRGRVTLLVPPVPLAIESARITSEVVMSAGCPLPQQSQAVSEAIPAVYWFIARSVRQTDQLTLRWFGPGGILVDTVSLSPAAGSYCFAASFDLKRVDLARRFGEWKAELTWNGTRQAATTFAVNPALQLAGGSCVEGASPQRIPVCPQFREASNTGQVLRLEFVRPDGDIDGESRAVWNSGQQFDYATTVATAGQWKVRVLADGALTGVLDVAVLSSIAVGRAEVLDGRFEFLLQQVPEGSRGRLEFVGPSGEVRESRDLDLSIADSVVEASIELPAFVELGRWRIRLYWDGTLLQTVSFDRLPARVVEQLLTADTRASLCRGASPEANPGTFAALESSARLWVKLDGVVSGVKPVVEFWEGGAVRARSDLAAFSTSGNWCVNAGLPIAGGLGAQIAGNWEARLLVGGVELVRSPFVIRRSSGLTESLRVAPLLGPGTLAIVRGESILTP